MSVDKAKLQKLRLLINENLRVQRGGSDPVPYIDVANVLSDVAARQNHAIFGRRGCGKTLLLQHTARTLPSTIRPIYLNCEDFKKHSFPNVLIEILDALFAELEKHLTGWFGRKKRSRQLIADVRKQLLDLRTKADQRDTEVRDLNSQEQKVTSDAALNVGTGSAGMKTADNLSEYWKGETERKYKLSENKIRDLDMWLPRLKQQVREFF
jgi:energy-coupling factor transporter ATP-binding protein EcfA2